MRLKAEMAVIASACAACCVPLVVAAAALVPPVVVAGAAAIAVGAGVAGLARWRGRDSGQPATAPRFPDDRRVTDYDRA